jgi:hypothetical protein
MAHSIADALRDLPDSLAHLADTLDKASPNLQVVVDGIIMEIGQPF